jgi:hypothetical protein
MNESNIADKEDRLTIKGCVYELAPLAIPLCIVVTIQNIVILVNYYKERTKLVAGLFMGIAVADILKAHGELAVSVTGILAYTGRVQKIVLYKTFFYCMVTNILGHSLSKLFNLVMTITLTSKVVNPFQRVNTSRVKKVLVIFTILILLLHVADMAISVALYEHVRKDKSYGPDYISYGFRSIAEVMNFPGLITTITVFCYSGYGGISCIVPMDPENGKFYRKFIYALFGYCAFHFICIPLTVLICMIIQIIFLRRSLQARETTSLIPDTFNRVSVTVLMVSGLFFLCNTGYFFLVVAYLVLSKYTDIKKGHSDQWYENVGIVYGIAELLLPLVFSFAYPIILISRKRDLRDRYLGHWRRITNSCGSRCCNNANEGEPGQ